MTDTTEKSYSPKKFRRKIPKVSRNYKRNIKEPKSFDKSEDELDMEKSIVNELLTEVLEKGKTYPIGTVHNGYKKIAEGRWEKDTNGSKPGGKVKVSDKHKSTMDEHLSSHKAKGEESKRVNKIAEELLSGGDVSKEDFDGFQEPMKEKLMQLKSAVSTLHQVGEDDEDFDAIKEAVSEAYTDLTDETQAHMKEFKPDLNKDKKEKAKSKYQGDPAAEGAAAARKDNEAAKDRTRKEGSSEGETVYSSDDMSIEYVKEMPDGSHEYKINYQPGDAERQEFDEKDADMSQEAQEWYVSMHPDGEHGGSTPEEYHDTEVEDELLNAIDSHLDKMSGGPKTPGAEGRDASIKENTKKSIIQETDMSDINKEMDQMADKMEKSADPKAVLKATIQQVGVEGLKKAMPSLDDEQKELLKEVLEEIKVEKAVSMDDAYEGDKKFITQENMGTEVEDGSDDEDEKLVKPAAAAQNHQGDVSPEGREGQVIKSVDETIDEVLKGFGQGQPVEDSTQKAYKSCGACEQYDKGCKACSTANGMKKSEESEGNKSEETIMKSKEELIALKDEIVKSYDDAGLSYNDELIKGEMKKRLLKEESQVEPTDQTKGGKKDKADKPSVPEIEVGKDADETADEAVAKVGKMKKSISYDSPNKRLAANTGGRNHHFSINGYYDEALQKAASEGKEVETLEKSEGEDEKVDGLNDIIEKGLDKDSDECKTEELFKSQTKGENVQKSFADEDMVEAMNMSKEDAEKVLGK